MIPLWAEAVSSRLRWHALPPMWMVVLVIVPLVMWLVRFFYQREAGKVGLRLRVTMGLLRVAAVLLVLGALFGPYTETIQGERFKRHLILCVDTSSSMRFNETYASDDALAGRLRDAAGYGSARDLGKKTRIELIRDVLGRDKAYLAKLSENFRVHLYRFDGDLANLMEPRLDETGAENAERLLRQLPKLEATGQVTRLGDAIQELSRSFGARNEPVAGVLLFTDGRQTGGGLEALEAARSAKSHEIRVYPVAVGDPAASFNIGVSRIDAPEVTLAGDDVFFTVTVHARGLKGRMVQLEASLLAADGSEKEPLPIESEPFELPGEDDEPVKVSFRHRFTEPGRYDMKIGVPQWPGEAVAGDNYQRHVLKVVKLRMRVLFVFAKPSFSYRFLKEALFRAEETIEAHVLLLSAEPEWPQEASRGLDPIQVFPQERKTLAPYDVVMFMDVDPRDARIAPGGEPNREALFGMLEDWVKQGGGLVLQAGRGGFLPQEYVTAELAALLPVIPFRGMLENRLDEIADTRTKKRYKLTNAGLSHPIMRVLEDSSKVREFWEGEAYAASNFFEWYVPVARAKSSATVLAVRRDEDPGTSLERAAHPILAIQDYGLGKVLWMAHDEFMRMRYDLENSNLYYWRFWSGIIRHLATYRLLNGNRRIKIWVDRGDSHYQRGESIQIEAKYLDENFAPVAPDPNDDSTQRRILKLRAPDGTETDVAVTAIPNDPPEGLFRTRITAGEPGTYSLVAEPEDGAEEMAETTFVVEDTAIEMRNPLLDRETLDSLALATLGKVLSLEDFAGLLKNPDIPSTSIVRSGEPQRTDLWDRAWILWLVVALLAAEWILRRTNLLL